MYPGYENWLQGEPNDDKGDEDCANVRGSKGFGWNDEGCDGFVETWDFIKPLFKTRFGKKMDVAKIGQVLDNLKMDPNEHVDNFAAKLNTNFSQLRDIIPLGEVVNVPAAREDRTDAVCAAIHRRDQPVQSQDEC